MVFRKSRGPDSSELAQQPAAFGEDPDRRQGDFVDYPLRLENAPHRVSRI